jgi:capsular polysaccharide biosynthesis protein
MNTTGENGWDQTSAKEIFGTLWKGKFIIIIITVLALIISAIFSYFVIPEKYVASASLNVTPVKISVFDYGRTVTFVDYLSTLPMNTKADYIQQVKSPQVLDEAIKKLDLKDDSGNLLSASALNNSVTVVDFPNMSRIEIRVTDTDPMRATQIANAISQSLAEYVSVTSNAKFAETVELIEGQLLAEEETLEEKKQILNEYCLNHEDMDVTKEEEKALTEMIVARKGEILDLEIQIAADIMTVDALGATDYLEDPIESEDIDLSIDLDLSGSYQVNVEPGDLDEALDLIFVNELKNRIIANQATKETLVQSVDELQDSLYELQVFISDTEGDYNKVYADKENSQSIYNAYEQRYREANVYASSNVGDTVIKITTEATGGVKIAPSEKKNIAVAGMVGLCAGVFVVLFINYVSKMKKSTQK